MRNGNSIKPRRPTLIVMAFILGFPLTGLAQYKITGPDGKVSYSDRPPAQATARTKEIDSRLAVGNSTATASLPLELRQTAARYPVTLYALKTCAGCEDGRQLLRQRGIPFAEKLVNDGDGEALRKLTGSRELPALTIGSQVLRGFSASEWTAYLDAAGYPKQSQLPLNYVAPAPIPLVQAAKPSAAVASATAAPPPPVVAPPPAPSGIRF